MRTSDGRGQSAEEAVLRLVQDHAAELLRFAGRFSHCPDDAHDAYQRSLEILVRRMRIEPPEHPVSWVRTVLRHEALSIRAQRQELVSRFEVDLDRHEARHDEDPAERAVGHERLRHAAEALQRLKPQEVTALVLRAEGLTYKEICARTGWSYTKTNRCVTEGRRALEERLGAIESGAECERWTPLLSLLADGEASAAELVSLRPHLRSCPACRATLRSFHAAPAQVAALVPPVLLPLAAAGSGGSLLGQVELALHALAERVTLAAMRVQGALEGLTGAKLAAVAASTAALAGSGAAIEQATRSEHASAHGPSAPIAAVAPPVAAPALMTIAGPLLTRSMAAARVRRSPRSAFAAQRRTDPSEFARGSDASVEFQSPARGTAASSAVTSSPRAAPQRATSEFVGP